MKNKTESNQPVKIYLLIFAYVAFSSLGMPDGMLGVAWPSIRSGFALPLDALGFLLTSSTVGYLISSFFIGRLIKRFGIGPLMVFSCLLSALTLFGYTVAPAWAVIVVLGVLAGFGAGVLDAGANTYLAAEYNDSQMQWLHASFGIGATLGPMIMTASLTQFAAWRPGYILVAVFKLALAIGFLFFLPYWKSSNKTGENGEAEKGLMDYHTSLWATLGRPQTWASILMFLLYTGAELTLGNWTYTLLTEGRGISPQMAGLWAGGFWATFTLGRVMAGVYASRLKLNTLMFYAMLLALLGGLLFWWNPLAVVSIVGVFMTGFCMAPIFPGLVSGTRERVGDQHAANTIGIQISAAGLGGALLPSLAGVLAQRISLETIPLMLVVSLLGLLIIFLISTPRGNVAVEN
ncbi:MAG: MFS transporter [Anaerolineae bacterium]|nr:MFS transporter [Anaerolineae bacterium]